MTVFGKSGMTYAIEWTDTLSAPLDWRFLNRVAVTGQSTAVLVNSLGLPAGTSTVYLRARKE